MTDSSCPERTDAEDPSARRSSAASMAWSVAAIVLVLSGVVHFFVWIVDGGGWEGPTSWRKPILFGLSSGLTAWSLGFVLVRVPCRIGDVVVASFSATCLVLEVGLITLQTWRGVPSHFNRTTAFDAGIDTAMTWLIAPVVLVVLDLSVRAMLELRGSPAMRLAIRAGMILLLFSCAVGLFIAVIGHEMVRRGLDPAVFGAAGVLKFPHGMMLHAIQWLPALAWACDRSRLTARQASTSVALATAAACGLLVFSLRQAFAGRARFDFATTESVIILTASLLALGYAWLRCGVALVPLRRRT